MKERPIIFNGDMVRAIKDGSKTQTRRPVKASTSDLLDLQKKYPHKKYNIECPLGKPGDRLWVRETWQGPLVDYDDAHSMFKDPTPYQTVENCVYRADGGPCPEFTDADDDLRQGWRPSIHMPHWASRITLEITAVRVERLNGISEADARAEGIKDGGCLECGDPEPCGCQHPTPDAVDAFAYLWQSIYGEENWIANPWVWVIEFKHVEVERD